MASGFPYKALSDPGLFARSVNVLLYLSNEALPEVIKKSASRDSKKSKTQSSENKLTTQCFVSS